MDALLNLPGSVITPNTYPVRCRPGNQPAGAVHPAGRVAGIVSRLAGPDAAGAVHVHSRRPPPPAMPSQPRWPPPDPQRPWPCPAGTLPTTTPTVDRGWLRRHRPRAVAVVASWRRPGAPGHAAAVMLPLRQPTAPAAALLPGPKADRPRPTHDRPVPVCRTVRPPWPIAPGSGRALSAVPECWQWSFGYSALRMPSQPDHIFANPPDGRQHYPREHRPTVTLPVPSARSASLAISRSAPLRRLRRTDAWPPEWWRSGKPDQLRHHAIH